MFQAVPVARAALCVALVAFIAPVAAAATLELRVTDREGQPAADVVVLVETKAQGPALPPPEPATVLQLRSRFVPALSVVQAGASVRFVNHDAYDHHVRSMPSGPLGATPPASQFELRQGPAGLQRQADSPAAVKTLVMDTPGPIGLGCHLHSSMRGHLYVADTPYFGKTDDNGFVRIAGVPAGEAVIRLWHPGQLSEQPTLALRMGEATVLMDARLNFTPPPRRPGRAR